MLPQTTLVGTLLHGLVGYDAQPAGMQVLFYVVVMVAIAIGMRWVAPSGHRQSEAGTRTTVTSV